MKIWLKTQKDLDLDLPRIWLNLFSHIVTIIQYSIWIWLTVSLCPHYFVFVMDEDIRYVRNKTKFHGVCCFDDSPDK